MKTPAEIGRRWQDHYLTHPGDDVEECVSAAIRERDAEHAADAACVLCPDQDDNDNARGYCADHGTEMRDRLDAALGLLTRWLSQHRDGGSTDPCGVATELVDETMQAVVRR